MRSSGVKDRLNELRSLASQIAAWTKQIQNSPTAVDPTTETYVFELHSILRRVDDYHEGQMTKPDGCGEVAAEIIGHAFHGDTEGSGIKDAIRTITLICISAKGKAK